MKVNLFATYRMMTGQRSFDLDLPPATTLRAAIEAIVVQYPILRESWLTSNGEIQPHLLVFINSHELSTLEGGLDIPLNPRDILEFVPPVGGGSF